VGYSKKTGRGKEFRGVTTAENLVCVGKGGTVKKNRHAKNAARQVSSRNRGKKKWGGEPKGKGNVFIDKKRHRVEIT